MRGNLRLIEQDRAFRIDPAGDERGNHFARARGQFRGDVRLADRVEIGKEEQALAPARSHFVLQPDPVADRAEIIAEVEVTRGLDARDDAH